MVVSKLQSTNTVKPYYLKLKGTEIKLISHNIKIQCIGVKYKTNTEVTV